MVVWLSARLFAHAGGSPLPAEMRALGRCHGSRSVPAVRPLWRCREGIRCLGWSPHGTRRSRLDEPAPFVGGVRRTLDRVANPCSGSC